ncbi:MAG: DUF3078 domain-containing protein [Bacteroidales bacterium]|jgi:hypothetical protein|nr:DUF3078 domain-containing protein [Bacteroidales bacterium]MBO7529308.1 DUF3078 domain-containing protein [Bacteroidales bacterium]
MKRLFLPLIALLLSVNVAFAQDDAPASAWTHGGNVGFNMAQSAFDNWAPGGQNNINFLGLLKYDINFKKDNHKWDNGIDLQLGYSYYDMDKDPLKTDDRIFFSSLYGYNIYNDKLFATANFTFQSQFTDGFDYASDSTNRISGFMVPGYFTLGLGIQWVPNEYFKVNFAPITARMTYVNDQRLADAGAFGVDKAEYDEEGNKTKDGEKIRWELGAHLTAEFKYEIFKNVSFSSKLIAFYDYLTEGNNALDESYTCPVDFDWDNALIMKVNDWLSCNLTARLVYDEDVKPVRGDSFRQFKEVLSIGISYKIP